MIFLGADHRGFELKEKIKDFLKSNNFEFIDLGNFKKDLEDDNPDFAFKVASKLVKDVINNKGIVFCGSGIGVDITANKIKGVLCGLGFKKEQIEEARRDDNINCLAIAADYTDLNTTQEIVLAFLKTEFLTLGRYKRRIEKIKIIENNL